MPKQFYKVRVISFEDRELDPSDLLTQQAAAVKLGMPLESVRQLVMRGALTLIEDLNSIGAHSGRRLVLKAELAAYAKKRARGGK